MLDLSPPQRSSSYHLVLKLKPPSLISLTSPSIQKARVANVVDTPQRKREGGQEAEGGREWEERKRRADGIAETADFDFPTSFKMRARLSFSFFCFPFS